ncbi:MAG: hypothetical protein ACYDCL_01625 [Myxococcales bacterium]
MRQTMSRRPWAFFTAMLAMSAAAGCNAPKTEPKSSAPTSRTPAVAATVFNPDHAHLFKPPTRTQVEAAQHNLLRRGTGPVSFGPSVPGACVTTDDLTYFGGPLLPSVKVVDIYWGSKAQTGNTTQLDAFFSAATNSSYFDWLKEYDSPTQSIGRGSFVGSYAIPDSAVPAGPAYTDLQIQQEVSALLAQGAVPANDGNTLYVNWFPPGDSITMDGSVSCSAFYAYHGGFTQNDTNVYYAVEPDLGPGGCNVVFDGLSTFDMTTMVASHELMESVTDPGIGIWIANNPSGGTMSAPVAWYDQTDSGEIGDLCSWNSPPAEVGGFVVQRVWSNSQHSCIYEPAGDPLGSCNGVCTDTASDPANCGGCGVTCSSGSCAASTCQGSSSCAAGLTLCSGQCVDLTTDPSDCGACGTVCPAGESCSAGVCQTCGAGLTDCNGNCVEITSDPNNCGGCGVVCSSGSCVAGACQTVTTCAAGQTLCFGACTDTQTDPNNCGACGNVCPSGSCVTGACVGSTCPAGQTLCSGACTDTTSDPNNCGGCGVICPSGVCTASACQGACAYPEVLCSGACTDTSSDPNNCGGCGNVCPSGVCSAGICTSASAGGCTSCQSDADCGSGAYCVQDPTDGAGYCGTDCSAGQGCANGDVCSTEQDYGTGSQQEVCYPTSGSCSSSGCSAGLTLCNGVCTSMSSDPNNCGSCGNVCASGTCAGGVCSTGCASGLSLCSGACTDTSTDPNNCGGCGVVCSSGSCAGGVCGSSTLACGHPGDFCNSSADCCGDYCQLNTCLCRSAGHPCAINSDCCNGGVCTAGLCG